MCIKPNPMVFECRFEGSQKDFLFWKLLAGAQGVLWVANISQIFDGLLHPLQSCQNQTSFWDASKQRPSTTRFGWIFYSKTCFAGTVSYEHTFHYFDKIMKEKNMNYVHLSQNLHIPCASKSKFAHTMCI